MRDLSIFLLAAIGLSACATGYQVPKGADVANVTFEKGYLDGLGFGKSSAQQYNFLGDGKCAAALAENIANFTWTGPKSKTEPVIAGKPVTLGAVNLNYDVSSMAGQIQTNQSIGCSSRVTFTPVIGESYRMKLIETSAGECKLEFANLRTGKFPDGAIINKELDCSAETES